MADSENTVWKNEEREISDEELRRVAILTGKHFGIKLGQNKKTLVLSRLNSILKERKIKTVSEYIAYLEDSGDADALNEFASRITTNHTYFYREHQHFKFLTEKVLADFHKNSCINKNKKFSLWCAGCSSGEEAYTIAMMLTEYAEKMKIVLNARILATDLSVKMIKQAESGEYQESQLKYLPAFLKCKYFTKTPDNVWHVKDVLKKMVDFQVFNLLTRIYPFQKEFDAIFCRNVFIYFEEETINNIIEKFSRCQPTGSYFFISHSEIIKEMYSGYQYVMPSVYIIGNRC